MNKHLILGVAMIAVVATAFGIAVAMSPQPSTLNITGTSRTDIATAPLPVAQNPSTPPGTNTATIQVSLNQSATALGMTLIPLEVNDSRCPSGAQCIWAGQLTVRVRITTAIGTTEQILKAGTPYATQAGTIEVVDATNAPNYLVTFTVTGK